MDIKIADPLTGEPVGFGESGELMARGFLVMKGYYNMPDRTAEAIDSEGLAAHRRSCDDERRRIRQHRGPG